MPYTRTRNTVSGIYETECKDRVRDAMPLVTSFRRARTIRRDNRDRLRAMKVPQL